MIFAPLLLATLALSTPYPSGSPAHPAASIAVKPLEVILTPPTRAMAGLPIILPFRLINHLDREIQTENIDDRKRRWVRLELLDEQGKQIAIEPLVTDEEAFYQPVGSNRPGMPKTVVTSYFIHSAPPIASVASAEGTIVTSKSLLPPSAGRYLLRAQVTLQYHWGQGRVINRQVKTNLIIPLTVTAADEASQKELVEELQRRATSADILSWPDCMAGLFALPESIGAPIWRSLALDRKRDTFDQNAVTRELEHLGTRTAVDILSDLWGGPVAKEPDSSALDTILRIYWATEDRSLKEYIKNAIAERGGDASLFEETP